MLKQMFLSTSSTKSSNKYSSFCLCTMHVCISREYSIKIKQSIVLYAKELEITWFDLSDSYAEAGVAHADLLPSYIKE